MFDTTLASTLEELESEWNRLEAQKSRLVARQLDLILKAELAQAPLARGCRSPREWLAGRGDLTIQTAGELVGLAERISPRLLQDLSDGRVTLDRAMVESKLEAEVADDTATRASRQFDCDTVDRLGARHRRHRRLDELTVAHERYVSMQPTLDYTAWRLAGLLPGVEGALIEQALQARADSFPAPPPGLRPTRGQLQADALVSICQDSVGSDEDGTGGGPTALLFVDTGLASARPGEEAGERGAETSNGVRVGPSVLEELLCTGRIGVTILENGKPLQASSTVHAIAPSLRRFILWRDHGVCTAAGCQSRYRLQPHHITPHHRGGPTSPDNLTLLCWYHHHVVIHTHGFRIDPDSPPHRRQFQPAHLTRPPP
jgi:hypothetical protein